MQHWSARLERLVEVYRGDFILIVQLINRFQKKKKKLGFKCLKLKIGCEIYIFYEETIRKKKQHLSEKCQISVIGHGRNAENLIYN